MRVLLFAGHFIQYSIELANGLAEEGATVGLVFHDETGAKLVGENWREMLHPNVQFFAKAGKPVMKPWTRSFVKNFFWVRRTVKKFQPDVVHLQDGNDFATLLMAWRTRYPVAATLHDVAAHPGEEKHRNWRMEFLIHRVLMPRARRKNYQFILHGEKLRRDFLEDWGAAEDAVHVVPHGILAGFAGPGESLEGHGVGEPRGPVLFFGRMMPYKGLNVFTKALPAVLEAVPDAQFVMAGRGPSLDEVRDQLAAYPQVEIRDEYIQSAEVAHLYRNACVNLAPYNEASQSGVVAAGYAFGVPAIATRVGALPEVVVDGDNGLLVDPEDPDALAAALIRYLQDTELRLKLQEGVRKWADGPLSWSSVAQKTLEVYAAARRKRKG